jgi:RimJ/RimL family protein N-acetyltransferase
MDQVTSPQGHAWPPDAAMDLAHADALIAERCFKEAVIWLSQGVRNHTAPENKLALARKLIALLIELGQPARARIVLAQVLQWTAVPPDWLVQMRFSLLPAWEQPLQGSTLRLRRMNSQDAQWLKALFADENFAARVNRDYGKRVNETPLPHVARQLDAHLRQLPAEMGAHVLAIERRDSSECLGLACLVGIDVQSLRAEFIIGFAKPDLTSATTVAEASALMLELAFGLLHLHRVTAALYSDNPRLNSLMKSLTAVGFQKEGVQRQYQQLADGRRVDVHLIGGLRDEVLERPLTRRLMQRYVRAASDRCARLPGPTPEP